MLTKLKIKLRQKASFQGYAVCQPDDQADFQRVAGGQVT